MAIRQLVEDFAKYPYLPRLSEPSVLLNAITDGLGLITWEYDSFAYADSFDEVAGRYRGLVQTAQRKSFSDLNTPGLLVKPDVAKSQIHAEKESSPPCGGWSDGDGEGSKKSPPTDKPDEKSSAVATEPSKPKRLHGSVELEPFRVGRDAGRIAEEVIAHMAGLNGAQVKVTLEIEATFPEGVPEQIIRTVTENSVALRFIAHGFERS